MKIIKVIDSKILNIFQYFANWIQSTFGKNNFVVAKICMVISAILFLAQIQFNIIIDSDKNWIMLTLFIGYCFITFWKEIQNTDKKLKNSPGLANPLVNESRISRILFLVLLVDIIVENISRAIPLISKGNYFDLKTYSNLTDLLLSLGMVSYIYFCACKPKTKRILSEDLVPPPQ